MPKPSQSEAHLMVAAIRVLQHQSQRPPSVEEIAALLQLSKEFVGHLLRALDGEGIVHTIQSPFDQRFEVKNHQKVELLPEEDKGPGFKDEVDAFHKEFEEKQKKLQDLFDSGEQDERQRKRFEKLDNELNRFKSPRRNPFGDDPD
jgi:DNA-binding transcriptional regulator GbsR (MarR family)